MNSITAPAAHFHPWYLVEGMGFSSKLGVWKSTCLGSKGLIGLHPWCESMLAMTSVIYNKQSIMVLASGPAKSVHPSKGSATLTTVKGEASFRPLYTMQDSGLSR
jgi:hypothetical protein